MLLTRVTSSGAACPGLIEATCLTIDDNARHHLIRGCLPRPH